MKKFRSTLMLERHSQNLSWMWINWGSILAGYDFGEKIKRYFRKSNLFLAFIFLVSGRRHSRYGRLGNRGKKGWGWNVRGVVAWSRRLQNFCCERRFFKLYISQEIQMSSILAKLGNTEVNQTCEISCQSQINVWYHIVIHKMYQQFFGTTL